MFKISLDLVPVATNLRDGYHQLILQIRSLKYESQLTRLWKSIVTDKYCLVFKDVSECVDTQIKQISVLLSCRVTLS